MWHGYEPAAESERRFRVTRFHRGFDNQFRDATVPMRSVKSVIENFAKGDDLYCIVVTPL